MKRDIHVKMYIHYVPHSKQNSCHSMRACVLCFHPSPAILRAHKNVGLQQRQSFGCQCRLMFRLDLLGHTNEELDGVGVQFGSAARSFMSSMVAFRNSLDRNLVTFATRRLKEDASPIQSNSGMAPSPTRFGGRRFYTNPQNFSA